MENRVIYEESNKLPSIVENTGNEALTEEKLAVPEKLREGQFGVRVDMKRMLKKLDLEVKSPSKYKSSKSLQNSDIFKLRRSNPKPSVKKRDKLTSKIVENKDWGNENAVGKVGFPTQLKIHKPKTNRTKAIFKAF